MSPFQLSGELGQIAVGLWGLLGLLVVIIHIVFATAVFNDACARPVRRRVLVGPGMWSLATLIGGVFVAGLYWFLHNATILATHDPVNDAHKAYDVQQRSDH